MKRFSKIVTMAGMAMALCSVTACNNADKDAADKTQQPEIVDAKTISEKVKNNLKSFTLDDANIDVSVAMSYSENEKACNIEATGELEIIQNPFTSKLIVNIQTQGESRKTSLDTEGYIYNDTDKGSTYLVLRKQDGTYAKTVLDTLLTGNDKKADKGDNDNKYSKESENDKESFELKNFAGGALLSEDLQGKIGDYIAKLEYNNTADIDGQTYDVLKGKIDSKVCDNLVKSLKENDETNKSVFGMYMSAVPDELGDIDYEVYVDKEGLISGISVDISNILKGISKDDNATAFIKIMMNKKDDIEITVPDAKTVDLQNLLE